ncbi:AAEL007935-PB, partial [Aedes aegypti]
MFDSSPSVFETFDSVIVLLKCIGLQPPVTSPKRQGQLRYRLINLVWLIFIGCFHGLLMLHFILGTDFARYNTGSVIVQQMLNAFYVARYLTCIVVSFFAYSCLDHSHRMLEKLNQASEMICRIDCKNPAPFGSVGSRGKLRMALVGSFLGSLMGSTIMNKNIAHYRGIADGLGVFYGFSRFLYSCGYVQIWLQSTVVLLLVRSRYVALRRIIRMYFPTTPSCGGFLSSTSHTETVICNEKEQLAVLKQIKILHDKLNDVVELVNYCFSVQITFCVGLCFVIGVVCSFGLFRAFIYRNELFYMGVLNFVWYMYYLFFVLFFIAVGSKITREGKRIGVLVHKAINCASSSAVINELNIFSQQLLHRSPVITCGLFVYDWTLLYTMIGATATYLIILIQFDVSFPNLVNVNGTQTAASGV